MCDNNNTNNDNIDNIREEEVALLGLPGNAAQSMEPNSAKRTITAAQSDDYSRPTIAAMNSALLQRSPAAETTSGALADKLSSSLASIATAGNAARRRMENNWGGGEEESSSSSSNGQASSNNNNNGEGPKVVTTGTATTSSGGDDPDSSAVRTGGSAASCNNNSLSSGDDRFYATAAAENEMDQKPRARVDTSATSTSSEVAQQQNHQHQRLQLQHQRHHFHHHHHHHHYHHHRQRKRPLAKSADDYGLPVLPMDDVDRLQQAAAAESHSTRHATVVAHHLPPPSSDSAASSGSGLEGGEGAAADNETTTLSHGGSLLIQPHREPVLNTIRRTFKKLARRDSTAGRSSETDSWNDQQHPLSHKKKKGVKHSPKPAPSLAAKRKRQQEPGEGGDDSSSDDNAGTNGSSSGSGTEGGYAGSASSNDNVARSPSVSSSEDGMMARRKRSKVTTTLTTAAGEATSRPLLSKKQESSLSISSEIADFSSGASESEVAETMKALREEILSESPSITSSSNNGDGSSDEQEEEARPVARRVAVQKRAERALLQASSEARKRHDARSHPPLSLQVPTNNGAQAQLPPRRNNVFINDSKPRGRLKMDDSGPILEGKPPILAVGCDIMAHVLTFLEPPDILQVLTMPLSKDWLNTFTRQPELWRVLCLVEPFKAPVDEESDDSGDDSFYSFPMKASSSSNHDFGKFRMLYTSFVRCMRYLERIKDDAQNGRPPSVIDFGATNDTSSHNIGANHNLQSFLARARGVVIRNEGRPEAAGSLTDSSDDDNNNNNNDVAAVARLAPAHPIGVSDDDSSSHLPRKKRRRGKDTTTKGGKKKPRYGRSMLTDRLLLPAQGGEAGNPELPWSCAVYSIVNWMVAFADVEGIQTMCLKVLPFLLEDEQQRITAQRAGLTDVVLRGMVMFPDSATLHTSAFHTIVLLARPLGGREGMLFHTSMVNSSGIFSSGAGGSQNGRNGIAVMLDSMRRFQQNELLQAMSCWSLVNIALVPAQKEVLVKLGGIAATANAMMAHAYNAEVQFRALFALINLVIPSVSLNPDEEEDQAPLLAADDSTERELLDESVEQIASLVVHAMKNFCSSEAILNRACLVLHNLSLTPEYHGVLLWTPNAYQMLEWCLTNYRTDQVLQQSAAGTLHRLQIYLSSDETLRARFAASIQAQQQQSLEQAHREAVILHQQHEQRLREEEQRQQESAQLPQQQP